VAAAVLAGGALPPDAARFVWQPRSHGLDIGMRSINLLKVAAEAELLRLRALLARQGRRAAFGAVAAIFMLGVLVLAEITGWQVLRLYVAPIPTTLILLGINFAIAALFGALAARSSPSHTEREALQVRRQALDAAGGGHFPSPRPSRSPARFCASGADAAGVGDRCSACSGDEVPEEQRCF